MIAGFGSRRDEEVRMSEFQRRVLEIPQEYSLFLGGGRGGGKSFCACLLCLKHAAEFGSRAQMLYLRRTHKGTQDFVNLTQEVFGKVYGPNARFNAAEGFWKLPGGATLEINQAETTSDLLKFQGRSKSLLIVDEAGHYPDPLIIDRMRSNLRSIASVPVRMVVLANPGDAGHGWLTRRYVNPAIPWRPFVEQQTGVSFVSCPSTYRQNEFIDKSAYERDLRAATSTDLELQKAWLDGSWAIARGAYFGSVLDEAVNGIAPWEGVTAKRLELKKSRTYCGDGIWLEAMGGDNWKWFIAHDFGTAAPSYTGVFALSPGAYGPDGKFYPRDSLLLLDELATYMPPNYNEGTGWTVPRLAEEIKGLCAKWEIKPTGVADDAIFNSHGGRDGSIAEEFGRERVYFNPAKKADRVSGWELLRRLMQNAGKRDLAGFYASKECSYFWETVPSLPRDPRKPADVDSKTADHAADCVRYAALKDRYGIRQRSF